MGAIAPKLDERLVAEGVVWREAGQRAKGIIPLTFDMRPTDNSATVRHGPPTLRNITVWVGYLPSGVFGPPCVHTMP